MNLALRVASLCTLLTFVSRAELSIGPVIPGNLGVNIHFTDPKPGEMTMLADAGFKFVRMDLDWARTEKAKGVYDFAPYERLLDELDRHGIRAMLILDYANPLYDDNRSPDTDEGRAAFARWAAAAAKQFKGRGVLWEMYNEPNIAPFWRPKPNADDYVKLALETGKAIRAAAPGETYIGPATSGVDLPFLEACFKAGLLDFWDAVTVHPYRQVDPETVEEDYRNLRRLLARYAPEDKKIPILSGEWGYSAAWAGVDEQRQAKLLARQWLINMSQDVGLSIWYDWHDDGPDPKEPEHHFGTVRHPHHAGRDPAYDPKPAYVAARTLANELRGYTFNKRLALDHHDDYMLLFTKGDDVKVVAWTRAREPKKVVLPSGVGEFTVTSHLGEQVAQVTSSPMGLRMTLTDAPVYLTPQQPNVLLRLAAAWDRVPKEVVVTEGRVSTIRLGFTNPLDREVFVSTPTSTHRYPVAARASQALTTVVQFGRWEPSQLRNVEWSFGAEGVVAQHTMILAPDAMRLTILPRCGKFLPVRLENPSGKPFESSMMLNHGGGRGTIDRLVLAEGQTEVTLLRSAPPVPEDAPYAVTVCLIDEAGRTETAAAARFRPIPLDPQRLELRAEGDAKVASDQSFSTVPAPDGLPAPGGGAVKIDYRFDAGWKYARLSPKPGPTLIDGTPVHLGVWVNGDGSGNILRARFLDDTGQTFQPDGPKLDFTGWRYVTFPLDGAKAGHWGGAKDGVVHHPIKLETILLIDNAARQKTQGTVHVSCPTVVYRE